MPPTPRSGPGSAALNWQPQYLITQDPKPPTNVYASRGAPECASTRLALNSVGGVVKQSSAAGQRFDAIMAAEAAAGSGRVPTRFLTLADLIEYGMLPRFGSEEGFVHPVTGQPNANLCRPRESFDASKTIFIFVSHRWLRPSWDPPSAGHPDDAENRKYKLILAALEKLRGKNAPIPEGMEVAIWIDFSCIDQDGAPASELTTWATSSPTAT